jgi:RNA polymerase sigma-70 factor, ECF subfamily
MSAHADFLKLILAHQDDLRAFLASLVRNAHDRDDVFQETVLTLWDKFDEYDRQRSFGAWARGIAVNKVLQYRSRTGSSPTPFSPQAIASIVDAFERQAAMGSDAIDALDKCMEPLPPESRRLLALRYVDWRPVATIAAEVGSTPAAMSKTLARLRARLYDCVQRQLGRPKQEKTP